MCGGLMQLVAYGAQDVYLSGNPQITFFKVVYRRHTNFSVEPIQQTWNGAGDFGRTVTCNINRNGDDVVEPDHYKVSIYTFHILYTAIGILFYILTFKVCVCLQSFKISIP